MAFDRRFELGLVWRAALLLGSFALLLLALQTPGLVAARLVAFGIALAALANVWAFVRRTNFEVARFIEAVRFEDFSQAFSTTSGSGFNALGTALDEAMRDLRNKRAAVSEEARYLSLIIDDTPVPLLTLDDDGVVLLLNKAARRQFDRHDGVRLADFAVYGPELVAALGLPPGERRLTRVVIDGVAERAVLAMARVERLGGGLTIVSLMPLQSELGAAELAAQTDLVRVLTHEIMNSLTPVTSLARTTSDLVAEAVQRDPGLGDALLAVETLASRADGILRFVGSYRQFAQSLTLRRRRFAVAAWAEEIARLARADPAGAKAGLSVEVTPPELVADADPDLLAQVVLNLIRNAGLAEHGTQPRRTRFAIIATQDRRLLIEVSDNGPGIPPERRDDVFLPFYTTRSEGTGVGLSFARQVVVAHGGSANVDVGPDGGALIRLLI
ncbi:sensor histidine kinase [Sphingosinicellaceae bacterium]|nr:sensor histidine kinase [Sphingosinicellaceae bacterium]